VATFAYQRQLEHGRERRPGQRRGGGERRSVTRAGLWLPHIRHVAAGVRFAPAQIGPLLGSWLAAAANRSARSLIPRSIFWLMAKLTASAGSTRSHAHGRV
jgi:hypothetical protein